ncbi:SKT5 protein [Plectosphaerella cucumerina]|uniref:SKT5 protein n=1 Tax=Plectosphaerella cucumerina TaxID=40658 RepID=A0A8K0X281_9PEZI|nr:SKT5 protein [Plectosphaerella cucumerina]
MSGGIGSPRLREAPVSPVRVNMQSDGWAQPSNADIEHARSRDGGSFVLADRTRERDLPRTPHSPQQAPHGGSPTPRQPAQRAYNDAYDYQSPDFDRKPMSPAAASRGRIGSGPNSPTPSRLSGNGRFDAPPRSQPAAPGRQASLDEDDNRHSRESDATTSTNRQHDSADSSAHTSASSIAGYNDPQDCPENGSAGSSLIEGHMPRNQSVPLFQYHHQQHYPQRVSSVPVPGSASHPDLNEAAAINRHLTPVSGFRRTSMPRPPSAYSAISDFGPRGRSPGLMPGGSHNRAPSVNSRKSPDPRPSSYAELLNVPYPQPAPAPISFDNTNLRNVVGNNASLLSAEKTLEMYRQNVKKTNDLSIQYSFAVFLISTAQEQGLDSDDTSQKKEKSRSSSQELVKEAKSILQKLSSAGYPFAQYYLADGFASGLFSKGKEDYNQAFPLFVLAAKHGHAESAYRSALCYEFGWGCRKDPAKAVQMLRISATKRHPGAMTRLGKACLSGDLGEKRYREGIKWMKLAAEAADTVYNAAPYQLGSLYETGYGDDVFKDETYAAELFTQAAELGHPEANFRMGEAYEHGKLGCPRDPALSVHFYTGAAEKGHAAAMMGLCAWYMVGAEPILEKDEEEAYEWARRSAELGFVKAQYAVGYFTEMGIGCRRDILEANVWYVKAADAGDERAKQRIAIIQAAVSGGTPMEVAPPRSGKMKKSGDDKDCILM